MMYMLMVHVITRVRYSTEAVNRLLTAKVQVAMVLIKYSFWHLMFY